MRIGIIGHGFVGSAVSNGFSVDTEQFIVDPKFTDNTVQELVNSKVEMTFICLPTPEVPKKLDVDTRIVREVLTELEKLNYEGIVVIKSTITPHHLDHLTLLSTLRIVYNPEFLTERNSLQEFVNPNMQILGGDIQDCIEVEKAYLNHSTVKIVPTFKTDLTSASLIKYTINSWLATKVSFFNDIYHLHQSSNADTSWNEFIDMLKRDPRVGDSHMEVPGSDGKFGFGGHCLPKDTKALLYYSKLAGAPLSLLQKVIEKNDQERLDSDPQKRVY